MQSLLNFSPETVFIYTGGNDADVQSWYGSERAAHYYREMVEILSKNNITRIIHLVYEGNLSRDRVM